MVPARIAIALAPLILWPATIRAQENPWERQVQQQLEHAAQTISRDGNGWAHDLQVGFMNADESEAFTLTLPSGASYALVGACDNDCTSLHLLLYNDAGNYEVASARTANEPPVVQLTPKEATRYRVKVVMAGCRLNPCWYGIALYRIR